MIVFESVYPFNHFSPLQSMYSSVYRTRQHWRGEMTFIFKRYIELFLNQFESENISGLRQTGPEVKSADLIADTWSKKWPTQVKKTNPTVTNSLKSSTSKSSIFCSCYARRKLRRSFYPAMETTDNNHHHRIIITIIPKIRWLVYSMVAVQNLLEKVTRETVNSIVIMSVYPA